MLPTEPWLGVNSRILPGETVESVRRFITDKIADPSLEVVCTKQHQVQNISPHDTNGFRLIEEVTKKYYPGTLVSPYLQMGGSDSRQYYRICDNVYRFMPIYIGDESDQYGAHNANERIPKEVLGRSVCFMMDFIRGYRGEQ